MSDLIELTDDSGLAVLVDRTEIALVRDCAPTSYASAVVFLKSGERITLQTNFQNVVERMKFSTDEGTTKND